MKEIRRITWLKRRQRTHVVSVGSSNKYFNSMDSFFETHFYAK